MCLFAFSTFGFVFIVVKAFYTDNSTTDPSVFSTVSVPLCDFSVREWEEKARARSERRSSAAVHKGAVDPQHLSAPPRLNPKHDMY